MFNKCNATSDLSLPHFATNFRTRHGPARHMRLGLSESHHCITRTCSIALEIIMPSCWHLDTTAVDHGCASRSLHKSHWSATIISHTTDADTNGREVHQIRQAYSSHMELIGRSQLRPCGISCQVARAAKYCGTVRRVRNLCT